MHCIFITINQICYCRQCFGKKNWKSIVFLRFVLLTIWLHWLALNIIFPKHRLSQTHQVYMFITVFPVAMLQITLNHLEHSSKNLLVPFHGKMLDPSRWCRCCKTRNYWSGPPIWSNNQNLLFFMWLPMPILFVQNIKTMSFIYPFL